MNEILRKKMYAHLFIVLFAIISQLQFWTIEAHYVQWEYRHNDADLPRPSRKLVPSEIMVDLTNDLSYRILHYHSISNRNNIAFSPTALTSVLISLYEGSLGRSSMEMKHVLGLPGNRDITRIGYRDIHRRLKTYFFEQENPLIGLSFNKDNVTISPEFEAILKFYGFDLAMDMISSVPSESIPEEEKTATDIPIPETTTEIEKLTTLMLNEFNNIKTTTEKIMTTNFTPINVTETTTATSTTLSPSLSTTTVAPSTMTTSLNPTTTETTEQTTSENFEVTESTTENVKRTTMYIQTFKPQPNPETSAALKQSPKIDNQNPIFPGSRNRNRVPSNQWSDMQPSAIRNSRQNTNRSKRHFFAGLGDFSGLSNIPPSAANGVVNTALDENVYVAFIPAVAPEPVQDYNIYNNFGSANLGSFELDQSYIAPKETSKNNIINHIFYLNNQETIQATYKTYNSVLNYQHIDALKISVLELELDSDEYNLMILLPDFTVDMDTAIASLKIAPTLRLLRKQLKPRWVQAIIPDFQMKGHIYLTNDLQNMGITEIFEPVRADFTPMSSENGIYVKHIEQSINVHIRTRSVDQIKRNIATQYRPIEVAVNHPFLFFIVDKELDVAIMAGKVLNPLNVRIQ